MECELSKARETVEKGERTAVLLLRRAATERAAEVHAMASALRGAESEMGARSAMLCDEAALIAQRCRCFVVFFGHRHRQALLELQ